MFQSQTNKTWERARSLAEYVAIDKKSNTKVKQMLVINIYKLHNIQLEVVQWQVKWVWIL